MLIMSSEAIDEVKNEEVAEIDNNEVIETANEEKPTEQIKEEDKTIEPIEKSKKTPHQRLACFATQLNLLNNQKQKPPQRN